MGKVLSDLWKGELLPFKEILKKSKRAETLKDIIDIEAKNLKISLTDKQKEKFEEYSKSIEEYVTHSNEEAFIYGFETALKIFLQLE